MYEEFIKNHARYSKVRRLAIAFSEEIDENAPFVFWGCKTRQDHRAIELLVKIGLIELHEKHERYRKKAVYRLKTSTTVDTSEETEEPRVWNDAFQESEEELTGGIFEELDGIELEDEDFDAEQKALLLEIQEDEIMSKYAEKHGKKMAIAGFLIATELSEGSASKEAIVEKVESRGISERTAERALSALGEEGLIEADGAGRSKRSYKKTL